MPFSLDKTQEAVINKISVDVNSVLDIGSGDGNLLNTINEQFPNTTLSACDYTDSFIKTENCNFKIVDLNAGHLPFPDNAFDLVTITEVVEHLENYHVIIREIYRVLKKNGQIIITTPNILNMKSRINFLKSGFWTLFGPLPLKTKSLESTGGHITPIHYFHLAYALSHSNFKNIELSSDKTQKSSLILYILLYPLILLSKIQFLRKETHKYKTVDQNNIEVTKAINSFTALTSRSIVVTASRLD